MLSLGIVVLAVSVIAERYTAIQTRRAFERAGGTVYASQGGPSKALSALALLSYAGIVVGVVLIALAIL